MLCLDMNNYYAQYVVLYVMERCCRVNTFCVIFGEAGVHIWARRPAIYLEFLRFSLSVNAVSRIVP
jgi:hypothetical protein